MTATEHKARKRKRPPRHQGTAECSKCGALTTYDRLCYRTQTAPKRALICDDCADRYAAWGMHGHG